MIARIIGDLDDILPLAAYCCECHVQQGFPAIWRLLITTGRVWWWAQNWVQSQTRPWGHFRALQGFDNKSRHKILRRNRGRRERDGAGRGPELSVNMTRVAGDAFGPVRDAFHSYYFFATITSRTALCRPDQIED
jgi:hypothetical protein